MDIEKEIGFWVQFIEEMIDDGYNVYAKGGSILGLQLIKIFINNISDDDFLFKTLNDCINLKLIKDWDFTSLIPKNRQTMLMEKAKKYGIIKEGETIIVLRMRECMKVGTEALFEISIKEDDPLSELELPMTTMKIEITKTNIKSLFELSKMFYSMVDMLTNPLTHDNFITLKENLINLEIIIPEHENGYFKVDNNFDEGGLSNFLLELIENTTPNTNEMQFLVAQIKQPDRMFFRLLGKNQNKSIMIEKFLENNSIENNSIENNSIENNSIEKPTWLLNVSHLNGLINDFTIEIGKLTTIIFSNYETKLNEIHNQIIFIDSYVGIIEREDVIKYCDVQIHYDDIQFDKIKKQYIDPYKMIMDSEISKNYIKKIKTLSTKYTDEYIKILIQVFDELDLVTNGVNMGRLVGLYHTFPIESTDLIKKIMPLMNVDIIYFERMIKRKKVINQLQKNGFYNLLFKIK